MSGANVDQQFSEAASVVGGAVLCNNEYPEPVSPDGLTEQIIDALLREVDVAAGVKPRPSVDGQAAQRRYGREARRCASAVVRVLPLCGVAFGPDGWEAA
jgi:hypothetical protein